MIDIDMRGFLTTFGAVFVAELGDKTQLATLSMSAGATSKWTVFLGSAMALCATSAIAVLGGALISRVVSPLWLRRIAGGVFVALGLVYMFSRRD